MGAVRVPIDNMSVDWNLSKKYMEIKQKVIPDKSLDYLFQTQDK